MGKKQVGCVYDGVVRAVAFAAKYNLINYRLIILFSNLSVGIPFFLLNQIYKFLDLRKTTTKNKLHVIILLLPFVLFKLTKIRLFGKCL